MTDSLTARTVHLPGHNGDDIEAYLAEPADGSTARGSVVVIHHMPGYDRAQKEATRRFAELGYNAICPNLYWRDAPGASPDDAAAAGRANGGVPDDRLVGDVEGAMTYLKALPTSNGKVGCIGYCSGGRQSVLAACSLPLQAAVDCYGAFVVNNPPEGMPIRSNIVDLIPSLGAPLLGLFGNDDKFPAPDEVNALEALLVENGKEFEFHRYDDAGHAFFSPDRPSYRVAAANDGWEQIATFYGRLLS